MAPKKKGKTKEEIEAERLAAEEEARKADAGAAAGAFQVLTQQLLHAGSEAALPIHLLTELTVSA
jgi:hypothetical protein